MWSQKVICLLGSILLFTAIGSYAQDGSIDDATPEITPTISNATVEATSTPTPTEFIPDVTPTATLEPVPTPTEIIPDATPTEEPTPVPTEIIPDATPTEEPTPVPTEIVDVTPEATATPTATPTVTPIPTTPPIVEACVTASEFYTSPEDGLHTIELGAVLISEAILADGTPAVMSLVDPASDGNLDILIPMSPADGIQKASIHLATQSCIDQYPKSANIQIHNLNGAYFSAYDEAGQIVADATAVNVTEEQVIALESSSNIKVVEIIGADVIVKKICWLCDASVEPTPTATPIIPDVTPEATPTLPPSEPPTGLVIVTDDYESTEDLSGGIDEDASGAAELVIKWDLDLNNPKDFHVYVLENAEGKPKYLGRTGSGDVNYLIWSADSLGIAGIYKRGPNFDSSYQFFIYAVFEDAPATGPFTNKASVFLMEDGSSSTPKPDPSIIVTDDEDSLEDLSGGEDVDAEDSAELVVRWENLPDQAKDLHIWVQVNNEGKAKFLARSEPSDGLFVWRSGVKNVGGNFKRGPQDGESYQFFIYVIRSGAPTSGPFSNSAPVLFTIGEDTEPEPTIEPTPVPVEKTCVAASDYYVASTTGLTQVELGGVMIANALLPDGTPVNLSVDDADGDGAFDVIIPWSESSAAAKAEILFATDICPENGPKIVDVVLSHGNSAALYALDQSGALVASSFAADVTEQQTLQLESSSGIRAIEIEGSEIVLYEICWLCDESVEPVPTATPVSGATDEPDLTPTPDLPTNSVTVTDDESSYEDLSNSVDIDSPDDIELVVRWDIDETDVKDVHLYVLEGLSGKPKYLGRTGGSGDNFFVWNVNEKNVAGAFKKGPQPETPYLFYVYVIYKGAPTSGPFSNAGPVEIQLGSVAEPTVEPTPVETPVVIDMDCVSPSDVYVNSVTGLHEVDLGAVVIHEALLPDATPVTLAVDECGGVLSVQVPWSESSALSKASINFTTKICDGIAPSSVKITLKHGASASLLAYDDSGALVATAAADSVTDVQTLALNSDSGIRIIEIEGSEICLLEFCWLCESSVEPDPTPVVVDPTPVPTTAPSYSVTVTDSEDDFEDLSGGQDVDSADDIGLTIRWELAFENVKEYHVYVLENQVGKPKFLGRSDDLYLTWTAGDKSISGPMRSGPQPGVLYEFYVYVLRKGEKATGPFSNSGAVEIVIGEPEPEATSTPNIDSGTDEIETTPTPTVTPTPTEVEAEEITVSVTVTDNELDTADLSGGQDYDNEDERALVIRWEIDSIENVKSVDVYVQTDYSEALIKLGDTKKANEAFLVWNDGSKDVEKEFQDGPQFGHVYLFSIVVNLKKGQPDQLGPFNASDVVEFLQTTPIEEPTEVPGIEDTPTPEIEPEPTDTPTKTPKAKPNPKASPTPELEPEPTFTNTPTKTPKTKPNPKASPTPELEPEPTKTYTPTKTPKAKNTPKITKTDTPTPVSEDDGPGNKPTKKPKG